MVIYFVIISREPAQIISSDSDDGFENCKLFVNAKKYFIKFL